MQSPTCTNIRVRSVADAQVIFFAVFNSILPIVSRRLDSEERRNIRSGSVYVWEERGPDAEATGLGIERWTDGIRWGPSRVRDEFLFYHEKELDLDLEALGHPFNLLPPNPFLHRRERLVKQTYSVFVDTDRGRRKWHLIAYFTQESVDDLYTVQDIPNLACLHVPAGRFRSARSVKGRPRSSQEHTVGTPSPPRRSHSPMYAPYPPRSQPHHQPSRPALSCESRFKVTPEGVQIPPLAFIENTHVPKRHPVDDRALRSFVLSY
ncbi:Gti1/Pac2 family-domain-containing protein [Amylostereum chailletii]|nr:Gti1/Pac2 family-domain-containing protein [Amylostereum chailletii]